MAKVEASRDAGIAAVEAEAPKVAQDLAQYEADLAEALQLADETYATSAYDAGHAAHNALQNVPSGSPPDLHTVAQTQVDTHSESVTRALTAHEASALLTATYEKALRDETDELKQAQIIKDYSIAAATLSLSFATAGYEASMSLTDDMTALILENLKEGHAASAASNANANNAGFELESALFAAAAALESTVATESASASKKSVGRQAEFDILIADEVKKHNTTVADEDRTVREKTAEAEHEKDSAITEAEATRDRAIADAYHSEAETIISAGEAFAAARKAAVEAYHEAMESGQDAYTQAMEAANGSYFSAGLAAAVAYHTDKLNFEESLIGGTLDTAGLQAAGFDSASIAIASAELALSEAQAQAAITERRARLAAATAYITSTENAKLDQASSLSGSESLKDKAIRTAELTYSVAESTADNDHARSMANAHHALASAAIDATESAQSANNDAELGYALAVASASHQYAISSINASHGEETGRINEGKRKHAEQVDAEKEKTTTAAENGAASATREAEATRNAADQLNEQDKNAKDADVDFNAGRSSTDEAIAALLSLLSSARAISQMKAGGLFSWIDNPHDYWNGEQSVYSMERQFGGSIGNTHASYDPPPPMTFDDALHTAGNFMAGWADNISLARGFVGLEHSATGLSHYVDQSSTAYQAGSFIGEVHTAAFSVAAGCNFKNMTTSQKMIVIDGYTDDVLDVVELGLKTYHGTADGWDYANLFASFAFGRVVGKALGGGCFVAGTPVHLGTPETVFVGTIGGYGAETVMSTSDSLLVEVDMKWVVASIGLAAARMLLMSGDRKKSKPAFVPAYARARRKPGNVAEPDTHESLASFDELTPGFEPTKAVQRALLGEPISEPTEQKALVDVQPSTSADMPFVTADEMFADKSTKRPSAWKKWSSVALLLLASLCLFKGLPGLSVDPAGSVVASVDSSAAAQATPQSSTLPIEDIRCGMRVAAGNPLEGFNQPDVEIDPATWRLVSLFWETPTGSLEADTLRPLDWINAHGGGGGYVAMGTSEIETVGYARITAVNDCPQIHTGPGRIVTTTYKHSPKSIVDVLVEGEPDPIRATGNHPFWSEDRHDFVRADELVPGERLRRKDQSLARVTSISHRGPPEPVYNLEVDAEHVYRVGVDGLLVHNSCHDHHPISKFLGGDKKQIFSRLDSSIRRELHQIQRENFRNAGIPLPIGGRTGSTREWQRYFQANPGMQDTAFSATLDASRSIDAKYGTNVTQDFWRNIIDGNYTSIP